MRLSKITIAIVLCGFLGLVASWKERAAAEKALYYIAYCAEEITGERTIAPDCIGVGGARCSLQEFLVYTWGPKKKAPPDTVRPRTVTGMPGGDIRGVSELQGKTFAQIFNKIFPAKFDTGFKVTFNADAGRLNGQPDYWRSLSRFGDPINRLETFATTPAHPGDPPRNPTTLEAEIIQLGKDAAHGVMALRMKNLEQYRLTSLGLLQELPPSFQIRTKTVSTGIPSQGSFKTLDVDETIRANEGGPDDTGHIREDLEDAMEKYRTRNSDIITHFDSLYASRQAIVGCGCDMPDFALQSDLLQQPRFRAITDSSEDL